MGTSPFYPQSNGKADAEFDSVLSDGSIRSSASACLLRTEQAGTSPQNTSLTSMFISNQTLFLLKTNFILSKRLTKRDYLSLFIYILAGINSVAFGFLHLKDGFPVLYVTLVALFHLFIVSYLQMRRGVYINRYQLKLYPLSAHTILHFLWLSEMIDFKILAFLIPVSVCAVSLSLSQDISVFVYVIYASASYIGFCLVFVIFKLLIKDFIWIDKFHLWSYPALVDSV